MSSDPALDALLRATTIAVVGLDTRTTRPAHEVASYLQSQGYRIIPVPVQKSEKEVLGERAYSSLQDIPEHVDLVNVFVRSDQTGPFVDDAITIGAGAVWLQLGITNHSAIAKALEAGLVATQNRCTKVEHQRANGP